MVEYTVNSRSGNAQIFVEIVDESVPTVSISSNVPSNGIFPSSRTLNLFSLVNNNGITGDVIYTWTEESGLDLTDLQIAPSGIFYIFF